MFDLNSFAQGADSLKGSVSKTIGTIGQSVNTLASNASGLMAGVESKLQSMAAGGSLAGLGSLLRSKNVLTALTASTKSAGAPAEFRTLGNKDWRVKLSYPLDVSYLQSEMLKPLIDTGGLVFPYTPQITISHSATYQAMDPVHNNYPFFSYQNSKVDSMTITGTFVCEDAVEARYWVAAVHYLRSITKMFYGETDNAGSPPPVVKLNGYGDYVFNNVPVIVTNFTVDLPNDVDYISTKFSGGVPVVTEYDRGVQTIDGVGYAPVKSTITVTCQPVYSRAKVREFRLSDFVNGAYISGQGYI